MSGPQIIIKDGNIASCGHCIYFSLHDCNRDDDLQFRPHLSEQSNSTTTCTTTQCLSRNHDERLLDAPISPNLNL